MNRRSFAKGMLAISTTSGFRLPLAKAANYRGKLFVFVQADGGWDPTSFCDPKANASGEPTINHWAEKAEIGQAGNIHYAPFGNNRAFFEKYYRRMLVVNGVDAQTNSHTVGIVHNWSRRISEGYPTTTALLAAYNGAELAMPYLSFGGFSTTAGVAVFTRLNNPGEIRNIARPRANRWNPNTDPHLSQSDWETLKRYRAETQTSRSRQPLSKITCQDPEVLAVDKSQFVWLDRGASPCVAALRPTSFQAERSGPALRGTRSAKRPRPPTGPQAG